MKTFNYVDCVLEACFGLKASTQRITLLSGTPSCFARAFISSRLILDIQSPVLSLATARESLGSYSVVARELLRSCSGVTP